MKKILLALVCFFAVASAVTVTAPTAYAQGPVRIDGAATLFFSCINTSTQAECTTTLNTSNVALTLVKSGGTTASSITCATGSVTCTAVGTAGFAISIPASYIDTPGRLDITFKYPTAQTLPYRYSVLEQISYDCYIGGTCVGVNDVRDSILSDSTPFAGANITSINTKTGYLPSATAGSAGGVFIAGTNAATTANITGNLSGSVGSVTAGVTLADDAITAAKIAANALGASELATDAVTEIQTGMFTIRRNVASQRFFMWMLDSDNAAVASLTNITCRIQKDIAAWAITNDTSESEVGGSGLGRGEYYIDLTQTETDADWIGIECVDGSGQAQTFRVSIQTQH